MHVQSHLINGRGITKNSPQQPRRHQLTHHAPPQKRVRPDQPGNEGGNLGMALHPGPNRARRVHHHRGGHPIRVQVCRNRRHHH